MWRTHSLPAASALLPTLYEEVSRESRHGTLRACATVHLAMEFKTIDAPLFSCPAPLAAVERIVLGHGSGGRLSAELLRDVFLPMFSNPVLDRLEDQATLEIGGVRVAFTTDSFVVNPFFFPGGDIGSLAVHGTINDLAMGGAHPLYSARLHSRGRPRYGSFAAGHGVHGGTAAAAGVPSLPATPK